MMEKRLKKTEEDQIEAVFMRWDTDKSGLLTHREIVEGLGSLSIPATEEEVASLLRFFDSNQDGELTLEEFREMMRVKYAQIIDAFRQLDTDGSGFLERGEVEEALRMLEMPFDTASVDRLLRRYDVNKDERISYDEFREFLVRVPEASVAAQLGYWQRAALLNISDD